MWLDSETPKGFKPPSVLAGDRFLELTDADVPGRISRPEFYSFWRDVLEAPQEILDIVMNGYEVPFVRGELPPPAFVDNNKSALENCSTDESESKDVGLTFTYGLMCREASHTSLHLFE